MSSQPSRQPAEQASLVILLSAEYLPGARSLVSDLAIADPKFVSLSEAFAMARVHLRARKIVIVAEPSEDVGFSLAIGLVMKLQPGSLVLSQPRSGRMWRGGMIAFLVRYLPAVLKQLIYSSLALVLQAIAGHLPARRRLRRIAASVRRVTYLRPVVGNTPSVGGALTHTHEVIAALADLGVEVAAITSDVVLAHTTPDGRGEDRRVRWEVARPSSSFGAIPASAGLGTDLALLRRGVRAALRSDLIYQRHSRFSLIGAIVAAATGKPLFLEYNGPEAYFGEHWQRTPLMSRLARLEDRSLAAADRIFVVSRVIEQDLLARGFDPNRVVINPNGVDPSRFAHGGGDAARRRHRISAARPVIGFVGSFGPWHGAPVLARAFARLATARPDALLLLVGDGPEKTDVAAILKEARAWSQVIDVGRVGPDEIPSYLDACDVLASPHCPIPGAHRFFGSPTKLFEYMAAGRAIVASDLEQIGEVLEHENTALLVPPGDDAALAEALERLLNDETLREHLGRGARAAAQEHHTWRQNAERILQEFNRLSWHTNPRGRQ